MDKPHSFLHSLAKHFKFASDKGSSNPQHNTRCHFLVLSLMNCLITAEFFVWSEGENEAELQKMASQEQKIFAYETLVTATKNFDAIHKLGEGGFGPVFKVKINEKFLKIRNSSLPNHGWIQELDY